MKHTLILLVSVFLLSHCGSGEDKSPQGTVNSNPDPEYIDVDHLNPGPILRDSLSPEQDEKIEYLHGVFQEVNQSSLDKWKTDFQRDANPDGEIAIWMAMAEGYKGYLENKDLSLDEKLEVYEVLLIRSVYPEEQALESLSLKYLTAEQAKEVMAGYQLAAEPIRVSKEE